MAYLMCMKIPSQIKSKHIIRDFDICRLYVEGYSSFEIKTLRKLDISVRRIEQIVYENKDFVKTNKEWHKTKRVQKLERQLRLKEKNKEESRKDVTDILDQLRREIEGDKPIIDQSQHTHYTKVEVVIDDKSDISSPSGTGNRIQGHEQVPSSSSG